MKKQTTSSNWLEGRKFARFPIEFLSLELTKVELEVLLIILSVVSLDGTTSTYSICQDTIAEMLDAFQKDGSPDRGYVTKICKRLNEKGVLTWVNPAGMDNVNIYTVHIPKTAILRPVTDRKSKEYLAGANARRQAKKEAYIKKNAEKLAERTKDIQPEDVPDLLSSTFETVEQSDVYEEALTHLDDDFSDFDDDYVEPETLDLMTFTKTVDNEHLRDLIILNIETQHPRFNHYSPERLQTVFLAAFTAESEKLMHKGEL